MDVTPRIAEGRQLIESYGAGRFKITGTVHEGSVLVFPDRVLDWPVTDFQSIDEASLSAFTASDTPEVDILLIGCGAQMRFVPPALRQALRDAGIVIDAMDTGAACRTYNVLMSEDRRVAAALIAVE
ncbi:Mth938-like domain-containing protein [Oceanibaculum indicum]|uniref:Uncharacterized protein n=1 Tax=Oceanibaculum indicum P24 TaxID=1207063 RepID=K2KE74_9PROT|nr:Mth938-like domain-containing protein [Oceanibaculum indicum]EKE75600.1 hypothetical protein P24_10276 [Oceanibaculum indicum P24]